MFTDNTSKEREFNLPCPIRLAGLTRRYAALVDQLPLGGGDGSSTSSPDGYCEAAETQRLQTLRLVVRILIKSQDDDLLFLNADQRSILESTLRRSSILLHYIGQKQQCAGDKTEENLAVEVTIVSKNDNEGNPLLQWSLVQENVMEGLRRDQLAAEEAELVQMADTPIPHASATATTEHFAMSATAASNLEQLGDAIRQEWGISGCKF